MSPSITTPYQPSDTGKLYGVRTDLFINAGSNAKIQPAKSDLNRNILLAIDMQVDFVHKDGTLAVPGAIKDTQRTIEFIYANAGHITEIIPSLDTHTIHSIFFPSWWINNDNKHPSPFTIITLQDFHENKWVPLHEYDWTETYLTQLNLFGKKQLTIWPYHTIEGTAGHLLSPAIFEALIFHSTARSYEPTILKKGTDPKTEHYGVFYPEVLNQNYFSESNTQNYITEISSADQIFVAGQAKSHCVLETLIQIHKTFGTLSHVTLLTDCTSSVIHPEIDFDDLANKELLKLQEEGLTLAKSTSISL